MTPPRVVLAVRMGRQQTGQVSERWVSGRVVTVPYVVVAICHSLAVRP